MPSSYSLYLLLFVSGQLVDNDTWTRCCVWEGDTQSNSDSNMDIGK